MWAESRRTSGSPFLFEQSVSISRAYVSPMLPLMDDTCSSTDTQDQLGPRQLSGRAFEGSTVFQSRSSKKDSSQRPAKYLPCLSGCICLAHPAIAANRSDGLVN